MDNEDIEIINKLRYSKYLDAFSGKGTQLMNMAIDVDGYGYYDNLPIQAFYSQTNNKLSPIFADNVEVKNEVKNKFMEVEEIKNEITRIEELMEESGRVLIRPSGTQPLVRVMLEGKEEGQINELANNLANLIKEKLS